MEKAQELQLHIMDQETEEAKPPENANITYLQPTVPQLRKYKWWIQMAIYTLFVLFGQSVATLLGRLYYEKGGKSKWMATLVQPAGFPLLLPLLYISRTKSEITEKPSALILASVYVILGIFLAADAMLYAIGLQYLPVSTFSLITATQLGFNAVFSFLLNSQKFTPFIVNSLVLLTISTTLLIFQIDSKGSTAIPKEKYVIGFLCTVGAAAGYALILSLTQLFFTKILKTQSFRVVLDMMIYESLVATCAILVGLFASGEWESLNREMGEFELGKLSYVMTLVWTVVAWQVFSIGAVGLILKVSSLFCNVISTLSLPIVPIAAVIIFHDKLNGVKVISMLLAIWGFVSYIYQHYLDNMKSKNKCPENVNNMSEASPFDRR